MKSSIQAIKRRISLKNWPIFRKILAGYILLTAFVVLLTAGASMFLVREYVLQSNRTELMQKAEGVAVSVGKLRNWTSIRQGNRWREYEALTDARAIYVNARGQSYQLLDRRVSTGEADLLGEENVWPDEKTIQKLLCCERETGILQAEFINAQILYAGVPVMNAAGEAIGGVILYRLLTDVRSVTTGVSMTLGVTGLLALLLAVGLALFLSGKITGPLRAITATARSMAEGQYGEQVQITQGDEIGQLGATLDSLSSRLSEIVLRLSDEKSRLQHILSGIGEGIIAVDRDGAVMHHNGTALELMELSTWPEDGEPIPEHLRALTEMLRVAMREGQALQTLWKTEESRSIAALVTPIRNAEGERIGAVALMRDVSEAERLEQLRRDYIANVSHELRTPLTGIRGMVEPLMDGYIETEEERAECYQIIYQETLRLEKLIGDMLDMSRLQDGKMLIELEEMELTGVLEAAARRMRDRALSGGIALTVRAGEDLPRVYGNEERILQVLIILLDNALSFTPADGSVEVFAEAIEGPWVAMGVKDTGAGIDPKDLPYIWERFYKADRARMLKSGTGLGLAIAKLAVELMGGEIFVRTQLGEGTTFTFTLGRAR